MPSKLKIRAGSVFSHLTVIREVAPYVYVYPSGKEVRRRQVEARCDCNGNVQIYLLGKLMSSRSPTRSCGCLRSVVSAQKATTHGLYYHPLNNTYTMMMRRCHDPDNESYKDYGERGILPCASWDHPVTGRKIFLDWYDALPSDEKRKPGETLHRIDNDRGYGPDNCMFADKDVQARERQATKRRRFDGRMIAERDIYDILVFRGEMYPKVTYNAFHLRLHHLRWTLRAAHTTPPQKKTRRM